MADQKRVYGDLGTLYQKCGGVFGVASFVDRCMDKWMADPTLNANSEVSKWHQSAQRPGFKFLVVQVVCSLTGGAQRYTGRPMDEAHKYMNISEAEWSVFMEVFMGVCEEFQLPGEVSGDLMVMMISMEDDCVTRPGDFVPPDPGRMQPRGNSLYAQLGGVYPIALFVDRLVDALIADPEVPIPLDGQKRNEASLKYLFVETVCSICGGPEARTAMNYDETKLLIPKAQWPVLCATASVAADHLQPAVRAQLMQKLQQHKNEIVDPSSADGQASAARVATVKNLQQAAAGNMLTQETICARHAAPGAAVAARRRVLGDPRSLYGRGGGVFGLAKLSDTLMDRWMANDSLNANAMVAKWHESHQKFGFKFLVTQLLGYLTGGPQRYTGQSMEIAHKHLSISQAQWQSFLQDATAVFQSFQLPAAVHQELMGIIQGFMSSCVLGRERAPPDPGMCRARPQTSNTYAHLGGVYPIAHYAERLVEEVLKGERVQIQWNELSDPLGTRHPPGLKYMVTELLCNGCGGPETVTSKGYDDAKLGINPLQWSSFMAIASECCAVWPTARHREIMMKIIEECKVELCVGLASAPGESGPHQRLMAEGFGFLQVNTALQQCNNDAEQALAMLRGGSVPQMIQFGTASLSQGDSDVGNLSDFGEGPAPAPRQRCPMGGGQGGRAAQQGISADVADCARCLFEQGCSIEKIAALMPNVDVEQVREAIQFDRYAQAARTLHKCKVQMANIAENLKMPEARVMAAVQDKGGHAAGAGMAGRSLGNIVQERLDELLNEDAELCCPVTMVLFREPVIASDGFMYEGDSVKALIRSQMPSPMTRETLEKQFLPAKQTKSACISFRESRTKELLELTAQVIAQEQRIAITALQRATEYIEFLKPRNAPTFTRTAIDLWDRTGRPAPAELMV